MGMFVDPTVNCSLKSRTKSGATNPSPTPSAMARKIQTVR